MGKQEETPTLSLGKLWVRIKEQPLQDKLVFFSQIVLVAASTLPWQRGMAGVGELSAWQLNSLELLAMLVPVVGLVMQLATLGGLRRGEPWSWLRWYRFAFLGLAAIILLDLLRLPMKGFGYWLALMAVCIQAWALYPLLDSRGLLPFRISR